MTAAGGELQRTPLFQRHLRLGARMIGFGGWEMPVSYSGILEEHKGVRERAGLFDVSHMGEIVVSGRGAAELCQRLTTNDVGRLSDGGVQYTLLCDENGGVIDDVTLYRRSGASYFFCVNAANGGKDYEWIKSNAGQVSVADISGETALLSLQGPEAVALLAALANVELRDLRRFRFVCGEVAGCEATISRTGYTGEDGFEIFLRGSDAERVWDRIFERGQTVGLAPVGLGARDTLRLEAALPLYGNELSSATTPLEAGLDRFVCLEVGYFIGCEPLRRQQREGVRRKLVGLALVDKGIARHGYQVIGQGKACGEVTSGGWSPTLGRSIALAYLDADPARESGEVAVLIRQRQARATIVPLPFYRREGRKQKI